MSGPRFFVGQIVEHAKFGYRGVVFGVDPEFSLSEEWYEQVARSRPPKDRPWYHVMVDGATHTTYVAERHLTASDDLSQIDHPALGQVFSRFD
ncbi:MAG: heat shock protein HspQ, partial [Gammaproteobacteria bacterium]